MSTPVTECLTTEFDTALAAGQPRSFTGLSEEIFDSVSQIDVEAWDHVRDSADIFMDPRLLQALETSMAATSQFRYVLYRDQNGTPTAIAVLCTFVIDIRVLANDAWSRWILGQLGKLSRKLVDYRIVFCGLPLSACQSSLRFAPGADSAAVLAMLDRALSRIAKQDRASVIVLKEFADEELPALKPLEALGYRQADSLPTHLVMLKSSTFEGYLKDVGLKKRHRIRQSMVKFSESGIEFITTSDLATIERLFTPETHRLYEAVLSKSETQFEHLPAAFFLETARQLPDCCEFQFALDKDRVVGFCISLLAGQTYHPMLIGLDYNISRDVGLYFNLAFRAIADAANAGATMVEVGQNSEEFKHTRLGAIQSRRSIYVRGGSATMNWVIGMLFQQLFPRHPLLSERQAEQQPG